MGELMRQYWIPAVRGDELPSPDSAPVRIKLLGEELIAYRVTSGAVGLIQNACPHRGASLFFGRNEEEGLRCVYHGWKFDVTGACVDMPSEPAESNFKSKVRAKAYAVHERGGIVWAYMGTREVPPPMPELEANMLEDGQYSLYTIFQECNYMQGWEGEMDTVHQAFLHYGSERPQELQEGTAGYYIARQRQAKFSVIDTEFGTSYGAYRPAEDDTYYWRIAHQMFPFYAMIPTGTLGIEVRFRAYVPMDDDHTICWTITGLNGDRPGREGLRGTGGTQSAGRSGGIEWLPNTTDWYGRWRLTQDPSNDFGIDREMQASGKSFSGIPNGAPSDFRISVTDDGDVTVVAVAGELDVATAPSLREELYRVIDRGVSKICVDLADMDFIDSTGLGVLVGALKRVKERDGVLELRSLPPSAQRVFEITGLTQAFTIT
jgi:anti-anti-sigma factor